MHGNLPRFCDQQGISKNKENANYTWEVLGFIPTGVYMFITIETLEQGVKYVQSRQ